MSTSYTIKPITEEDITQFFTFFKRSITSQFPEYTKKTQLYFLRNDYSLEKIKTIIKNKTKYLYMAIDTGTVAGYLFGNKVYGGIGFCEWVAVDDKYKKKGIGSALLKVYEEQVVADGGHKIHLWSLESNIPFYNKNGYIFLGKILENYFGTDDCFMYKPLRTPEERNYLCSFLK